jgi:flagellar hook-associated protein 1 FlgK
MSLFSSMQLANNSLQANQIALQVVGNNIANASTPGYSREVTTFTPAPSAPDGPALVGTGVEVLGVTQQIDNFLEERLRSANSDASSSQTNQSTYQQLEGVLGSLGNSSVGSDLNSFVSSISNILNQPGTSSVTNLAVLQGQTLTGDLNNLSSRVTQMRSDLDTQVAGAVDNVNQLVTQITNLNGQISTLEQGGNTNSQAASLRDQRNLALTQLSQLVNIKTQQESDGQVNVFMGGNYLVFERQSNLLTTVKTTDRGSTITNVEIAGSNASADISSGQLAGLINSRDQILGGFEDQLNSFAGTVANEFNKAYSSGQGSAGYSTLTSTYPVTSANAPLETAGLKFTPVSGSFDVQVYNKQTGQTQTTTIPVSLNGLDSGDTTLNQLAKSLNGVNGISATVSPTGQLNLASTSPSLTFTFGNDTSGTLAALGLNTFFTGSTAADIGVNQAVVNAPNTFAASGAGIGSDTSNAVKLAGFLDQPLDSQNGQTINQLNTQMTSDVSEASAAATSVANGYSSYQSTLQSQEQSTSGVNIDEEAVNMLQFQHAYQASAQFITVINQLLTVLTQL